MLVGIVAALALGIGANLTTATAATVAAKSNCKAPPAPHVDWAGCDKVHADLESAKLNGADLRRTNFTRAGLLAAVLSRADGVQVNLSRAVLSDALLIRATLTDGNLTRADLFGATLTGATLTRATLIDANLAGASINRADLTRATLKGANMSGTHVGGVTWNDTVCPDGTNSDHDHGSCKGHLG